ncbi:hypothetical protein RB594_001049 [Gaeumannomyces avenae]
MEATNETSVFHKFQCLPSELRVKIWEEALPEESDTTLFAHERWDYVYWPQEGMDDEINFENISESWTRADFRVYDVPAVRMAPLLNANREARHVAVAWACQHGYRKARRGAGDGDGNGPAPLVMRRRVDPAVDAVYYPTAEAPSARFHEARDMMMYNDPDNDEGSFVSFVKAVALPRAMIEEVSMETWRRIKLMHRRWDVLYVVLGPQPDNLAGGVWELHHHPVYGPGSLVWDMEAGAFYNAQGGDVTVDGDVSAVVDAVARALADVADDVTDMELRLARAVRRG